MNVLSHLLSKLRPVSNRIWVKNSDNSAHQGKTRSHDMKYLRTHKIFFAQKGWKRIAKSLLSLFLIWIMKEITPSLKIYRHDRFFSCYDFTLDHSYIRLVA